MSFEPKPKVADSVDVEIRYLFGNPRLLPKEVERKMKIFTGIRSF